MIIPATRVALALALLTTAACGGASTAEPTGPVAGGDATVDESAPAEEQIVALVENLASRVSRAGDDCPGVNQGIAGWLDAHEGRAGELTAQVEAKNSGITDARVDELDARLDRAWDAVFAGAKACPDVTKPSMDRLDVLFGAR